MNEELLPTRRRVLFGAGSAAATLLLAACSSSTSGSVTTTTATPSASPSPSGSASSGGAESPSASASESASASGAAVSITIKDFAFNPTPLTVAPGTKITVTNQDSTSHTLTSSTPGAFNTGTLSPGQSATITAPNQPASYEYICTIHPNMQGILIVQ
ncbi:cupredoxin domain-containing protein [Kitasatospora sp. NBC_00374]|uniref:cupredoxin domain-containing protein n=1 Tax=Kitasatospora sp. NBC_00374 TaxID=2975964 RepID=UPI0030E30624